MTMQKTLAALGAAAAFTMIADPAAAQQFARKGRFSIAAERLFGLPTIGRSEIDIDGVPGDVDYDTTGVGFLGQGSFDPLIEFYTAPRVGFDYFVIDGLSIGGSLALWIDNREVGNDDNDNNRLVFTLAPRVGYAAMFADWVGIWPRGGVSFSHQKFDVAPLPGPGDDTTLNSFAFNVEAPFVFVPTDHVSVLFGPAFDIAMVAGGEFEAGGVTNDYDASILHFGMYAGLGAWW